MALNFTANQYEKAFSPTKLCNWGVGKKSVAPKKRNDVTKIIVDDRGHILPGLRKYCKSSWAGLFQGTYNLPRKITRKRADDMAHGDMLTSWEKRSAHVPVIVDPTAMKLAKNDPSLDKENKAVENKDIPKYPELPKPTPSRHSSSPSVYSNKSNNVLHDIKNYPEPEKRLEHRDSRGSRDNNEPILTDVFTNELVAKNLRLNNQKHHRLPDAVDNNSYNALQMKRESNPGLALNIDPTSSAIGCKVFHSPGPTQCSKLKVFRPKTAAAKEVKLEENDRPKTTSRLKKKSKPLSEMDLAIYWDIPASAELKNDLNPAPAVFTRVPADDYRKQVLDAEVPSLIGSDNSSEPKIQPKKHGTNASAVMDVVNKESKPDSPCATEISEKKYNSTPSSVLSKRHSSTPSLSQKSDKYHHHQEQRDEIIENCSKPIKSSPPNLCDAAQKRSKSSPNLANVGIQVNGNKFGRPCVACEFRRSGSSRKIEHDEYKSAFKAGKLTNYAVGKNYIERMRKSRNVRVPKPKIPFSRKDYSIRTLAPPFSIWPRAAGNDYPDHWRLASVYQHSYKPLEARKAPLIKTVFQ